MVTFGDYPSKHILSLDSAKIIMDCFKQDFLEVHNHMYSTPIDPSYVYYNKIKSMSMDEMSKDFKIPPTGLCFLHSIKKICKNHSIDKVMQWSWIKTSDNEHVYKYTLSNPRKQEQNREYMCIYVTLKEEK